MKWAIALFSLTSSLAVAAPEVWTGDYVPPPEPVSGPLTVGAFVFPGWYRDTGRGDYPYRTHDEDSEWRLIATCPAPRPLLGFYDDSLPEVNDWHIKWALDHGISFFAFDWYWNAGEHRLLRTLEQGFLQARYAPQMKFCIHWCNHGLDWKDRPYNAPTDADFQTPALVEMIEYCAERYFSRPNYLTVDGRPVFIVWDSRRLIAANGGPEGFRAALAAMNAVLAKRGIGELYLVAIGDLQETAAAGFSAMTDYGYYGTNFDSPYEWRGGYGVPYTAIMEFHETAWRQRARARLPYLLALGSNWDSRPRHGDAAVTVVGRTPELFEQLCLQSLRHTPRGRRAPHLAIIEAWNEWGEGSFIEPDQQFGFAFLDVIRRVFAKAPESHIDYVPAPERVARLSLLQGEELVRARAMESQPYPDPPLARRTTRWRVDRLLPPGPVLKRWEFTGGTEGWQPYHVTTLQVRQGILIARVAEEDPQLIVDNVGVAIEDLQCLALRTRVSPGIDLAQVYFSIVADPALSWDKSFTIPLRPDGLWHEYQIMRRPQGNWRGVLKLLRLDIGTPGDRIELDWVRLYGKSERGGGGL
mgnify:CR=1 FL=1